MNALGFDLRFKVDAEGAFMHHSPHLHGTLSRHGLQVNNNALQTQMAFCLTGITLHSHNL